jgi:hypothetical protein
VRGDPPGLVRGDLVEMLPVLVEQAPADATLVVFHSAVLAYLPSDARARFVTQVSAMPGHWVSNEGPEVVPGVAETAATDAPAELAHFLLALDGQARAWTQGHGRALWWIGT